MMGDAEKRISPCETDPYIRELLVKSVLLDLTQGYRFLIDFDSEEAPEPTYDADTIVNAICQERKVIRLPP